ncbi:aldehyde dehydrogenase, partial [Escherichia coli]
MTVDASANSLFIFIISILSIKLTGNDSNLLIVFYVQIMPDDF